MAVKLGGAGALGLNAGAVHSPQRDDLQIAYGNHTNVTASDTVSTGLNTVLAVVVSLKDDPAASADVGIVSADVGDQAGTPAAGSFLLKSWEQADATVATTFGEEISWIAVGY